MLVKSILVAAFVALGAVSASPNANAPNVDVYARNGHPDCGRQATWDHHQRACVCKDHGMNFDEHKKTCACPHGEEWNGRKCEKKHDGHHPRDEHPDCGRDATYDRHTRQCVCKNHGMNYDARRKTCACPRGDEWNGRKCEKKHDGHHPRGTPDCGREATYDRGKRECVCKNHGMNFDPRHKACACPNGDVWTGRVCQRDCGRSATFNPRENRCVCTRSIFEFDQRSKACGCPRGKKFDERKNRCV